MVIQDSDLTLGYQQPKVSLPFIMRSPAAGTYGLRLGMTSHLLISVPPGFLAMSSQGSISRRGPWRAGSSRSGLACPLQAGAGVGRSCLTRPASHSPGETLAYSTRSSLFVVRVQSGRWL